MVLHRIGRIEKGTPGFKLALLGTGEPQARDEHGCTYVWTQAKRRQIKRSRLFLLRQVHFPPATILSSSFLLRLPFCSSIQPT